MQPFVICVEFFISLAHKLKKLLQDSMTGSMLKEKKSILAVHDTCASHKQAMYSWSLIQRILKKISSTVHRLESGREQTIKSNCHCIASIAEVIILFCKQQLAYGVIWSKLCHTIEGIL